MYALVYWLNKFHSVNQNESVKQFMTEKGMYRYCNAALSKWFVVNIQQGLGCTHWLPVHLERAHSCPPLPFPSGLDASHFS